MEHKLMATLDADARRAVDNVRAAAERIWRTPLHRYYTDHTVDHSERIVALLDGLTAGMMDTDRVLSPVEVYVLLAAAYLHDIGMQNEKFASGDLEEIRKVHHQISAEMIFQAAEDPAKAVNLGLPGDPGLVEAVALVAKGHRKVALNAAEYDPLVHGGETLRLRLLVALLRFADELDIDHRRVDLELIKLMNPPVESQLHWCKCHHVSGVSVEDEYIRVAYRFPRDRSDYEGLIVPLVETDVRARLADLEEIFRADAVKVALGRPQVRLMRLVQPLLPEVEALARERVGASRLSPATPSGAPASTTVFDRRGQRVEHQVDVAGDHVDQRPTGSKYEIHIERASGLAIGDGARVITGGGNDAGAPADSVASLRRQLSEAEASRQLIRERKAQYVMEVDVPLQLIKEERRLLARIAELKRELGAQ